MFRCLVAVVLLALPGVAAAEALVGLVIGVSDGDTLTLLDDSKQQHKVRLDGIDAPEAGQAYGGRAKQSLAALAFDRRAEATCPKTDRYGRRVCKVVVGGVDVGLEQIRRGMAWHFKRYENEQGAEDRAAYSAAEEEARQAGRGLWRDRSPVPPWEWREGRRRPQQTAASSFGQAVLSASHVGLPMPSPPA
jgi:endonuclease YncB( thermonuclease family)